MYRVCATTRVTPCTSVCSTCRTVRGVSLARHAALLECTTTRGPPPTTRPSRVLNTPHLTFTPPSTVTHALVPRSTSPVPTQVHELEELFTTKLGVWTRVVAYHFLFQNKQLAQDVLGLRQRGMPAWRRAFVRLCYPLLRAAIRSGFKVHDQGHVARCMEGVRQVFDQVGNWVGWRQGGREAYKLPGKLPAM